MLVEEDEKQQKVEIFTADYLRHIHEDYKLGPALSVTSSKRKKGTSTIRALPAGSHEEAPVYWAAVKGESSTIKKLVENGGNVNTPGICGMTPVAAAAGLGFVDVIKTLVDMGADLEAKDVDGNTPVCIASFEGNLEVIETLIDLGADVNVRGIRGWTPVLIAAQLARDTQIGLIETLVELGADINIRGGNGETALDLAATSLNIDTALLLANLGADIASYMMSTVAPTSDIHDLFSTFCHSCSRSPCSSETMYALFSLTKLILSVQLMSMDNIDNIDDIEEIYHWEVEISRTWLQRGLRKNILRINHISYDVRRRFILIADRIFCESLSMNIANDGGAQNPSLSNSEKARRYTELVCFLFDEQMLREVLALRLTCRTSHDELRRFPVHVSSSYHELESNMIENYIAYDSARFVSAKFIQGIIVGMHANLHVHL